MNKAAISSGDNVPGLLDDDTRSGSETEVGRPESQPGPLKADEGMLKRPIFLVGSERSGSTLFRLMMDHHPQVAFFFEFEYTVSRMTDGEGWPDLKAYHEFLEQDRIFRAARLTIDRSLDYPHLIDSFLRQKRDRDHKPLVGATVHFEYDRLLRIWPDARFIHILRDGRDVARSVIANGLAGNMYMASRTWERAEALWSRFAPTLPADRWIEVRYEELVTQTEAVLRRVCEFVGIPYDPAMLSYSEDSTYAKPTTVRMYQWREKLSTYEVQLAEARIGDLLAARGYELSGYPRLKITPMRQRILRMHDRILRNAANRRAYGNWLWTYASITRRFWPERHKVLQRLMDRMTTRRLK